MTYLIKFKVLNWRFSKYLGNWGKIRHFPFHFLSIRNAERGEQSHEAKPWDLGWRTQCWSQKIIPISVPFWHAEFWELRDTRGSQEQPQKPGFTWNCSCCPKISHGSHSSSSLRWVIGARVPPPTKTQTNSKPIKVMFAPLPWKPSFLRSLPLLRTGKCSIEKSWKNLSGLALLPTPSLSPGGCTLCPITLLCSSPFSMTLRMIDTSSWVLWFSFLKKTKYKLMSSNCHVDLFLTFLVSGVLAMTLMMNKERDYSP